MASKNTAIARRRPSLPIRWLFDRYPAIMLDDKKMLDYGCGKGVDADAYNMDKYDPHHFPGGICPHREYDIIFCTYVFNVLTEIERAEAAYYMLGLLKGNATVFITVRRDLPPNGKQTRHCYQYNVRLPFAAVRETSAYCIYMAHQHDLARYLDGILKEDLI